LRFWEEVREGEKNERDREEDKQGHSVKMDTKGGERLKRGERWGGLWRG